MSSEYFDDNWQNTQRGVMNWRQIDWQGDYNPNKDFKDNAVKYINDIRTYKHYMMDVLKNFNGLIWIIVIPLASFVYWNQKRKLMKFKEKNAEHFV